MTFRVAIFSLNQWALDFDGNKDRIRQSIEMALRVGAIYRAGPELELCGYSLEDAFYEWDTVYHSWTCLLEIIEDYKSVNIILDIGMPIYNSGLYNCRVIIHKGKILCIRAKTSLAQMCIYREARHFEKWDLKSGLTQFKLPSYVADELEQESVPFGADFILEVQPPGEEDPIRIGWDICQELWDPKNVSSDLYQLYGCHLVLNGSASYWELRKLDEIDKIVKDVSYRGGACYAFSNHLGCDGQRYVFYGRSCIYDKGKLIAMTTLKRDKFHEIEMAYHDIDSRAINVNRAHMRIHICETNNFNSSYDLELDKKGLITCRDLPKDCNRLYLKLKKYNHDRAYLARMEPIGSLPSISYEEEINYYSPLWLWDYLRRSKMRGFIIPLSGGLDSGSVAILVYQMCKLIKPTEMHVIEYFSSVHKMNDHIIYQLNSPEKICKILLKCCYLSTKYSSNETRERAMKLSAAIGAEFKHIDIQETYNNFRNFLISSNDKKDKEQESKSSPSSSSQITLLDQNLQARLRKDAIYFLSEGNRIVLGTGNVDEAIMGYFTKYDCSSADINPIGGLCKRDLKGYLEFYRKEASEELSKVLKSIIDAPPSAELTGADQRDELEIGLTYDDISILGKVRRGMYSCCGPYGAFEFLWRHRSTSPFNMLFSLSKAQGKSDRELATGLAKQIKIFYDRYARNRHKLTILTPSLYAETYSPDDNRFDHRHILFCPWTEQYKAIDKRVEEMDDINNKFTLKHDSDHDFRRIFGYI